MSLLDFSHLQFVLANKGSPVALTQSVGAAAEALQLVDQQISVLQFVHIQGVFEGESQMASAVPGMQAAAREWPDTRAAVVAAARATVTQGPAVAILGAQTLSPEQIAAQLNAFSSVILAGLVAEFASAGAKFAAFDAAMDKAYSVAVNANSTATAAITRDTQQVQNQIDDLNSKEDHLKSAGSVILGIITFGGTVIAQMRDIENQIGRLRDTQRTLALQESGYRSALGGFRNAQQATKIAAMALETVNTSLAQATNSLKDVIAATSSNAIVMQAELNAFKTEFAGAVSQASRLVG